MTETWTGKIEGAAEAAGEPAGAAKLDATKPDVVWVGTAYDYELTVQPLVGTPDLIITMQNTQTRATSRLRAIDYRAAAPSASRPPDRKVDVGFGYRAVDHAQPTAAVQAGGGGAPYGQVGAAVGFGGGGVTGYAYTPPVPPQVSSVQSQRTLTPAILGMRALEDFSSAIREFSRAAETRTKRQEVLVESAVMALTAIGEAIGETARRFALLAEAHGRVADANEQQAVAHGGLAKRAMEWIEKSFHAVR